MCGKGLAVFIALVFPLLALNGVFIWVACGISLWIAGSVGGPWFPSAPWSSHPAPILWAVLAGLLCVPTTWFILFRACRVVNPPRAGQNPKDIAKDQPFGLLRQGLLVLGGFILAYTLAFAIWRIAYYVPLPGGGAVRPMSLENRAIERPSSEPGEFGPAPVQARPVIEAMRAVIADDEARFRSAFTADIREEMDRDEHWHNKFEREVRPNMFKELGGVPWIAMEFRFEGDAHQGTVKMVHNGVVMGAAPVAKEEGEWKMNRH